jgi:thioredoxin 1
MAGGGAELARARLGRLLGGLVRSLPTDCPVVEELARQYEGKLKVYKVDVDQEQHLAMQYGIMSIPTLLLFKNGQVVEQIVGALPKGAIEQRIAKHL